MSSFLKSFIHIVPVVISIIKSVPDIIRAWKAIFKKKEISNAGERERKKEEKKSSENK